MAVPDVDGNLAFHSGGARADGWRRDLIAPSELPSRAQSEIGLRFACGVHDEVLPVGDLVQTRELILIAASNTPGNKSTAAIH